MTQVEIRTILRKEIKDRVKSAETTDRLRWSRVDLCTEINHSADEIAQEFLHIHGSKSWTTVAGTQAYAFSKTDYFVGHPAGIVWIDYIITTGGNHYNIPVQDYVDFATFMHLEENASNTSSPNYWSFWNNSLYIPKPSWAVANSLTAYICKTQTPLLTDGTADTTDLSGDVSLHRLIALHAAKEVARQDKAINLGSYLEQKYANEESRAKRRHSPKFVGPVFTAMRDF